MELSCSSLASKYLDEGYASNSRSEVMARTRKPLGESTGNVQPQNFVSGLCHQGHLFSPLSHGIPTPPVLPTQALPSGYGLGLRGHNSFLRDDIPAPSSLMGVSRGSRNPFFDWKHFADYRHKVMQKEKDNENPKWPNDLEEDFCDAILLIPMMGRKKYSSGGNLFGRNELISEYLWLMHRLKNPPPPGTVIPTGEEREGHAGFRTRKEVSSHIQVAKGYFIAHPLFHMFFPLRNDDYEEGKASRGKRDDKDVESFKNNPVLVDVASGRRPEQRPNYDYWAQLLRGDADVFVRPKMCWVYVSSSEIELSEDRRSAIAHDGTRLHADAYDADGNRREGKGDYPHLRLNVDKDIRRDLDRCRVGEAGRRTPPSQLLHSYTRTLTQRTSCSVKGIAKKLEAFPRIEAMLNEAHKIHDPSHETTSRCVSGPCDTFHFDVTLNLHPTSGFPQGTNLVAAVLLSISRPELVGHSWRSITTIIKPRELMLNPGKGNGEDVWQDQPRSCSHQRDAIEVEFPAQAFAGAFVKLGQAINLERDQRDRERAARQQKSNQKSKSSRAGDEDDKDDDDSLTNEEFFDKHADHRMPGHMAVANDLLKQVCMYQEIFSAAPAPPASSIDELTSGERQRPWIRRAVIIWTFSPCRQEVVLKAKKRGSKKQERELVTVAPATNWRFISKRDPSSQHHQDRVYVKPDSLDFKSSPSPFGSGGDVTASDITNLDFSASTGSYETVASQSQSLGLPQYRNQARRPSLRTRHYSHPQGPPPLSLVTGFSPNHHGSDSSGLATPPPTAALAISYSHAYDPVDISNHLSFLSDGSAVESQASGGGGEDPFFPHSASTSYDDPASWSATHPTAPTVGGSAWSSARRVSSGGDYGPDLGGGSLLWSAPDSGDDSGFYTVNQQHHSHQDHSNSVSAIPMTHEPPTDLWTTGATHDALMAVATTEPWIQSHSLSAVESDLHLGHQFPQPYYQGDADLASPAIHTDRYLSYEHAGAHQQAWPHSGLDQLHHASRAQQPQQQQQYQEEQIHQDHDLDSLPTDLDTSHDDGFGFNFGGANVPVNTDPDQSDLEPTGALRYEQHLTPIKNRKRSREEHDSVDPELDDAEGRDILPPTRKRKFGDKEMRERAALLGDLPDVARERAGSASA